MGEAEGVAEALGKALEMAGDGRQTPTLSRNEGGRRQGYAPSGAQRPGRRQGYSPDEYPWRAKGVGSTEDLPRAPGIGSGPPDEDL
jgi:hypothetical protein